MTIESAEASTDKILMRKKIKEFEVKTGTIFSLLENYQKGILKLKDEYKINKIHNRKPRFILEEYK